jgi:hypothetical protein
MGNHRLISHELTFGDAMPLLGTMTDSSTREAVIEMLTMLMNCTLLRYTTQLCSQSELTLWFKVIHVQANMHKHKHP